MEMANISSNYQVKRLSVGRVSSDPLNRRVTGINNRHTYPVDVGTGSGEAECEDNLSDDGCSVAGTEYSVGVALEATVERTYVIIQLPVSSNIPASRHKQNCMASTIVLPYVHL
jgi:hypothetical protein